MFYHRGPYKILTASVLRSSAEGERLRSTAKLSYVTPQDKIKFVSIQDKLSLYTTR